jgi:lipid-A-disaccharide synthase
MTMETIYKIFIIAGEASGDANGAELVKDLSELNQNILFYGIGGSKLKNKNVNIVQEYSSVNYIGYSNVIKNIRKIKRVLNKTIEYVKNLNPDLIILIDFPGFNLKFAELVKKFYKGKIIYYISPQIWAWHHSRIEKIRKYIDRMLVIFPFEVEFYKNLNYNVDYVGHPLLRKIDSFFKENQRIESDTLKICLLPGSRIEEIERILPTLARVAEVFRNEYSAEISLIYPEYIKPQFYKKILKGRYCNLILNSDDNHFQTLLNSDLVLTKFGTTTLELALLNIPFVSVYKAGIFNYLIAKMLSDIKYVSMPNILMKKQIVKEFIQGDMTAEKIFSECKKILTDISYKKEMFDNFKKIRQIFENTPIDKSATEIILEEIDKMN